MKLTTTPGSTWRKDLITCALSLLLFIWVIGGAWLYLTDPTGGSESIYTLVTRAWSQGPATSSSPAVTRAPVAGPGVAAAAGSILWVGGCLSDQCGPYEEATEGTGWVVAWERVVTNAHVLAGMSSAVVRVGREGTPYAATVVIFDPVRDLAVLSVPGLRAPALTLGTPLTNVGQSAFVAGYPAGGPYFAMETKVIAVGPITINDGRPEGRDSYQLHGYAEQGSSGGPLLSPAGDVVGVVYAGGTATASVEALTLVEAQPVLDAAATATTPVSTGTR